MLRNKDFDDVNIFALMREAITWAEKARYHSPPNPWVGALVILEGKIVGKGFTQPPGSSHAEIMALSEAKDKAAGATLITTLEPCSHHGRTPPCCEAIIKSGIRKVIVGIEDPDANVKGQGIAWLKKAGLEVVENCLSEEVARSLRPYLHHRKTGLPFVIAKIGTSLDSKMTDSRGNSEWITSEKARQRVHQLRAESQAILVGSETALRDQPKLTVRHPPFPRTQPLRVVLDRRGRLQNGYDLILRENHLQDALRLLGEKGILQVMVEGGPELLSSFLKEDLVDLLYTHTNGRIFGSGKSLKELDQISSVQRFYPESTTLYGDTVEVIWSRLSP